MTTNLPAPLVEADALIFARKFVAEFHREGGTLVRSFAVFGYRESRFCPAALRTGRTTLRDPSASAHRWPARAMTMRRTC
jgi:hypothetical protein